MGKDCLTRFNSVLTETPIRISFAGLITILLATAINSEAQSGSGTLPKNGGASGYTYPLEYIHTSTAQLHQSDSGYSISNTYPPTNDIFIHASTSEIMATQSSIFVENEGSEAIKVTPFLEDQTTSSDQPSVVYGLIDTSTIFTALHSSIYEATKTDVIPKESAAVSQSESLDSHLEYSTESSTESTREGKQENIPLGQCRDTRLSICRNVVPYKKTTLPNVVGDTDYVAVNRSLPFFQLILKSQCNRRMLQLVCSIVEPKCANFRALPPCRKFCRVATYGCAEYIPATLPISNVFSCERYPDSNDPSVCVNLAKNEECLSDEFKCPDNTCIPKEWQCDGVRDCVYAVDESNCTVSDVNKACTSEEFQCDRKCVPGRWRCDGERDCQDGTDESGCPKQAECGSGRFSCLDGTGCIPRRWVCDGKAECRDNSDEKDCSQKDCAKEDFRCKNGICIPRIWRCDGQDDCKDNSDELDCNTAAPIRV